MDVHHNARLTPHYRALLVDRVIKGQPIKGVAMQFGVSVRTVNKWLQRYRAEGGRGLQDRSCKPQRSPRATARELQLAVVALRRQRLTLVAIGQQLGVSHMMVARVWRKHALKPQRLDRYMASDDPDFERKAADIIGLYLHPPQHAAVFCVDEKTAIQALDRLDPVLPLSPGRAERPDEIEFSGGDRGKFYRPGTALRLPAYLNAEVQTCLAPRIAETMRREARKKLLDAMQRLRKANAPPLTEEDIAAEVEAARTARKGSKTQ